VYPFFYADVDFRQMVDKLPSGTSLTIISDSCHSGGLIDNEKEQIGPSTVTRSIDAMNQKSKPRYISHESLLHHLGGLSGVESHHIGDHLAHLFGGDASDKFLQKIYQAVRDLFIYLFVHSSAQINDNGTFSFFFLAMNNVTLHGVNKYGLIDTVSINTCFRCYILA
jgi:hypothetical protein